MKHARLYAPESYWEASREEREARCNGCGPKGFGLLVPDTVWGLRITPACDIHDWMYCFGKTEADKEEADSVFLNNMIRIIDAGTSFNLLRWLRQQRAHKYYWSVKELGGPAFWSGKNPRGTEGLVPIYA